MAGEGAERSVRERVLSWWVQATEPKEDAARSRGCRTGKQKYIVLTVIRSPQFFHSSLCFFAPSLGAPTTRMARGTERRRRRVRAHITKVLCCVFCKTNRLRRLPLPRCMAWPLQNNLLTVRATVVVIFGRFLDQKSPAARPVPAVVGASPTIVARSLKECCWVDDHPLIDRPHGR